VSAERPWIVDERETRGLGVTKAFEKACKRCGVMKPLGQYRGDAFQRDGKKGVCRWCEMIARWRSQGVRGEFPLAPPVNCEICGRYNATLNMDHDHETGWFRGFLCTSCNIGLGHLRDNEETVARALAYLRQANARSDAADTA
jgi:hypothetical protein